MSDGHRQELDRQMRDVLVQLSMCSHVAAPSYDPRGRSGATDSVDLTGGDKGPIGHARAYGLPFAEPTSRYPGAKDDDHRAALVQAARDELEHLRGRTTRARPIGETIAQRDARMLREGEGFTAKDVAANFRVLERYVRKVRLRGSRHPETGQETNGVHGVDRPERARQLRADGATTREIAEALGVHQTQVMRWTRRNAA